LDAAARPQLITPNQSIAEAWSAHSGYTRIAASQTSGESRKWPAGPLNGLIAVEA
jgi:hypothetical protein